MPQTLGARYTMQQGAGVSYEPVRKNGWFVTIAAVGAGASDLTLACRSVTLPRYDLPAHRMWRVNESVQYQGRGVSRDITVRVYDVIAPNILQDVWDWCLLTYNANAGVASSATTGGPTLGYMSNAKSTCTIQQNDITGNPVRSWTVYGCWSKNTPAAEGLDYDGDDALDFSFTLVNDYFNMTQQAA